MGSALDRHSRILYARLRCGSAGSDSGLGNNSSSKQKFRYWPYRVYPHGNITACTSVTARFVSWRRGRLAVLPHSAGIFSSGDTILHILL